MKVQLNHPGEQKPFKLGHGYLKINDAIIREWNNDNNHYRKFIQQKGYYLDDLEDNSPKQAELFFWGEWEGNSIFRPFYQNNYELMPNGIHQPFHSIAIRGTQNTDPYVFGDDFKYCVCKQNGKLTELAENDLILFGSVYPSKNKFLIDTVFVVKSYVLSSEVRSNKGCSYSKIYREETLEQLYEYLKISNSEYENDVANANSNKTKTKIPKTSRSNKTDEHSNQKRIYHGKTWWDDNHYFSFVPCKLSSENNGFERFCLNLDNNKFNFSKNPTGISYLKKCNLTPKELWQEIAVECKNQGFKLGIKIEEPMESNILDNI